MSSSCGFSLESYAHALFCASSASLSACSKTELRNVLNANGFSHQSLSKEYIVSHFSSLILFQPFYSSLGDSVTPIQLEKPEVVVDLTALGWLDGAIVDAESPLVSPAEGIVLVHQQTGSHSSGMNGDTSRSRSQFAQSQVSDLADHAKRIPDGHLKTLKGNTIPTSHLEMVPLIVNENSSEIRGNVLLEIAEAAHVSATQDASDQPSVLVPPGRQPGAVGRVESSPLSVLQLSSAEAVQSCHQDSLLENWNKRRDRGGLEMATAIEEPVKRFCNDTEDCTSVADQRIFSGRKPDAEHAMMERCKALREAALNSLISMPNAGPKATNNLESSNTNGMVCFKPGLL